jgi:hypothetical protein
MVGLPQLWVADGRTKIITTGVACSTTTTKQQQTNNNNNNNNNNKQQPAAQVLGCFVLVNLRGIFVRISGDYGIDRNRVGSISKEQREVKFRRQRKSWI